MNLRGEVAALKSDHINPKLDARIPAIPHTSV